MNKKNILFLCIISIVVLSGCIKSNETVEFEDSLQQIDKQLESNLQNININFQKYDSLYNAKNIDLTKITNFIILDMKRVEKNIVNNMNDFEEIFNEYNNKRNVINIEKLYKKNIILVNNTDTKNNDFTLGKSKIDFCLTKMQIYRELLIMIDYDEYNITEISDKIDLWYDDNIGICVNAFEKYS